jgi:AcrR family transcriptional regulator
MPHQPSDTRERILQTALMLFSTRGYHNTGIADILKESGVKRGSLYHHFASKRELGLAAIDEMVRLLAEEGAGRHLRINGHPIDRMLKMIDELPGVVKLQTGEPLTPSLALRLGAVNAEFRERLSTRYAAFIGELEAIVRRGVAEGQIVESVDPRVLTRVFLVMCDGMQFTSVVGLPEAYWEDARRWLKGYFNSLRKSVSRKGRGDRRRPKSTSREGKPGDNTTATKAAGTAPTEGRSQAQRRQGRI